MEQGPATEIMVNPKHPYTKALIDAHPKFGHTGRKNYGTLVKKEREPATGKCCPFFSRCGIASKGVCNVNTPELKKTDGQHWVACFFAND